MKAIMYHYVRPYDIHFPYLKNLHFEDFKKQLDFFENKYGIISKDEFLNYFKKNNLNNNNKIILTFDDGLSCHYNYVFPELKKRNLWGIFYISTSPLINNKILDVHKTHILLSKINSKIIYDYLIRLINDKMLDTAKYDEFKKFTYNNQKNDNYTLMVKRITNYYLSYKYRSKILKEIFNYFITDQKQIINKFYLKSDQIKEMHQNGMTIGSHTVNHPVMSRLSNINQRYEIEESFSYLQKNIKEFNPKTFCYPYGGFHSFSDETEQILDENKVLFSFNVEQRDIELRDIKNRQQALPRYDCNKFKFGKVRNNLNKDYK